MRTALITISILFLFSLSSCKRRHHQHHSGLQRPKLVVGIVVDQMRWDFLYRYHSKYGRNGFKRLLREGHSCANTHIDYAPTYTAPGHACIYTGSVPAIHGITGNNWYDYKEKASVYCTDDTMKTIGSSSTAGKMSPRKMLSTTITDELRLATNFQSKVIGIALKDRGSILPAGHTGNAAYFFDGAEGKWITSSYYMDELPEWVNRFNDLKLPETYLSKDWDTLKGVRYSESTIDDAGWEKKFKNEQSAVFPHRVSELKTDFTMLRETPSGNTITLDFARAAVIAERLGSDTVSDFLAVSLSSTDYIGHRFGPNSVEMEDCYLRLDADLDSFFTFLDRQVGKGNYLLFLTADHGGAHVPEYFRENKLPAGEIRMDSLEKALKGLLQNKYRTDSLLLDFQNMQFYLNNDLIARKKIDRIALKQTIKEIVLQWQGVANVLDLENLPLENVPSVLKECISRGVYEKRSGDLFVLHDPGWFDHYASLASTHGTVYAYDTHIPLVWMGWRIRHGESFEEAHMTDIAPTLAALLHIQEPSGNIGKPIISIVQESHRRKYGH